MKNKLTDLNNHLFEQLERLNDEGLSDKDLKQELKRTKAMTDVSDQIINNAKISLDATKLRMDFGHGVEKVMPVMLENKKDE